MKRHSMKYRITDLLELFRGLVYMTRSFVVQRLLQMTKNKLQRNLVLLTFPFFTFPVSLVLALPFQEPVPGTYPCLVSNESPFDVNAQDAGATLEIVSEQTYKLSTATASEEGSITTSELGEDLKDTAQVFQSGSVVTFQPSSGSAPYFAMFFVDAQNNRYILIQNNNGVHIRCQSQGADIAATFERAANGQTIPTPVTNERIPQLTPLETIMPGTYQCNYRYASYDLDSESIVADSPFNIFSFQLFKTNEYSCSSLGANVREPGNVDGCDYAGTPGTGNFSYDSVSGSLTWLDGNAEIWFSNLITSYGQAANGATSFVMYDEEEDIYSGQIEHPNVYTCTLTSEVRAASPSEQESEEYQLLPATTTAPPPPAGAGGLSGLYINYSDDFGLSYDTTMDVNGNITYTPEVGYSAPAFIYFLENGYVYEGLYPWGFAELDCSRMKVDNTPLCNTYILQNGTIQFGNDEPQPFKQSEENTIRLGENISDFWTKQEPLAADTRLEETWEYVTAGGFGGTGVDTLTLRQDGTFEWQYSGTVSYSTPDSVADATGVDVYVGGTSTDAKTGTYRIDGYTLELTLGNGAIEKVLFILDHDDDGSPGNIWLGGATRYLNVNQ